MKWVGDITEIPTGTGGRGPKLYLATMIDLYSRRLLGAATSLHPDADLACAAIRMAVAARGGQHAITGVIFHTDRGSTYTADRFTNLCRRLGIRQSMGRVGSCFDNAAEAFFSTLEWEVLSRHEFATTDQAAATVFEWCYGFYNHRRRHAATGMISPINYENTAATRSGRRCAAASPTTGPQSRLGRPVLLHVPTTHVLSSCGGRAGLAGSWVWSGGLLDWSRHYVTR